MLDFSTPKYERLNVQSIHISIQYGYLTSNLFTN